VETNGKKRKRKKRPKKRFFCFNSW